jgi:hypothetical protein
VGGKGIKGKSHIVESVIKGKSAFMEAHCHIFQFKRLNSYNTYNRHKEREMKKRLQQLFIAAAALVALLLTMASLSTAALLTLPDPTQPYAGEYVAWAHDDFWSFSGVKLETIQGLTDTPLPVSTYGDYATEFKGVGTGTLDIILYTGANGATNPGFENPVQNANGNSKYFEGLWGLGVQEKGPVTVGQVLDYLHAYDPNNNIPVFMFDLNQAGAANKSDLSFVGRVYLAKPDKTPAGIEWAFDESPQGTGYSGDNRGPADADNPGFSELGDFDPDAYSTAIAFKGGSGAIDYVAYAPMMDLSQYNRNWLFVTEFHMGDNPDDDYAGRPLNGGFEEIYLTGRVRSYVPLPPAVLLLGTGFLGLVGIRRNYRKRQPL